ncbi:JAB domain-containing protein [bacterium]|nr:JAB domain-containing protein [bacterium]
MEYKTIQRIETHIVREGQSNFKFTCPLDSVKYMQELQNSDIEKVIAVYLNSQNEVICESVISTGSIGYSALSLRDIVKIALLVGATGAILLHNHPAGSLQASNEDKKITQRIQQCFELFEIKLIDHIIVTATNHFSFADKQLLV